MAAANIATRQGPDNKVRTRRLSDFCARSALWSAAARRRFRGNTRQEMCPAGIGKCSGDLPKVYKSSVLSRGKIQALVAHAFDENLLLGEVVAADGADVPL